MATEGTSLQSQRVDHALRIVGQIAEAQAIAAGGRVGFTPAAIVDSKVRYALRRAAITLRQMRDELPERDAVATSPRSTLISRLPAGSYQDASSAGNPQREREVRESGSLELVKHRSTAAPGECVSIVAKQIWSVAVESHYLPKRSRHPPSILTFLPQDPDSQVFWYSNADVRKGQEAAETFRSIAFGSVSMVNCRSTPETSPFMAKSHGSLRLPGSQPRRRRPHRTGTSCEGAPGPPSRSARSWR